MMADPNIASGAARPAGNTTHAYTRAAVDDYLHAIWQRRQALEAEIMTARQRSNRATRAVARLDSLEREVGASLVAAYAEHVGSLRLRSGHRPALESAPEAILDLTDTVDAYSPEPDDLSDLAAGAPEGFGDEFFGPSPDASPNGSRNGNSAGAHRG
jgi:hypothetical protein